MDTCVKMPTGKYKLFELLEDYGVRMLSYGNASGGKFFGPHRSFLVKINENIEFFSIGVTTYCRSTSPNKVKTCIVVAHDDEKESHYALQLVVEDNVTVIGDKVYFYLMEKLRSEDKEAEKLMNLEYLSKIGIHKSSMASGFCLEVL